MNRFMPAYTMNNSPPKSGSPRYSDHSCHSFIIHEELRPQELSNSSDERDAITPPQRYIPYSWQLPCSTPTYEYTTTSSPVSTITPQRWWSSTPNSDIENHSASIKQEPSSPSSEITNQHPFSVESLLGDIMDRKSDPTIPAQVFNSTYINGQINSYIVYQSLLTKFLSQPPLSPIAIKEVHPSDTSSHKSNVVYWCHVCNALCVNSEDGTRHRHVHTTNGDKCRLKSTLYRHQGCVTAHERLDEDRIQCGLCDKVVSHCFFSKHQRLHEGHFCEECGKEFSTNSRLQDHKNTHTGKTPFTCTVCDRQFAKRSSWTQHQRYHRDQGSFACQFCKKCFNSKYARAVHERLHTGENPYQCTHPGCKRTYPQKIQLKLHMNSHR